MKTELFPSLGPHCALKARRSRAQATPVTPGTARHPGDNDRSLQEALEQKRPTSLWRKLTHPFDYGNSGDNG